MNKAPVHSLDKKICIDLANRLIQLTSCNLSEVQSISEINGNLIVAIFENITGSSVPDLITCEDKAVENSLNIQAVIDTLSLDILGTSLSHINGEHIVAGNVLPLHNLLEILERLPGFLKTQKEQIKKKIPIERKIFRKRLRTSSTTQSESDYQSSVQSKETVIEKSLSEISAVNEDDSPVYSDLKCKEANKTKMKSKTISRIRNSKVNSSPYPRRNLKTRLKKTTSGAKKAFSDEEYIFPTAENEVDFTQNIATIHSVTKKDTKCLHKGIFHEGNIIVERKVSKLNDRSLKKIKSAEEHNIEDLYDTNFKKGLSLLLDKNKNIKSRALQVRKSYLQSLKKPIGRKSLISCKKAYLLPYDLRPQSKLTFTQKSIRPHAVSKTKEKILSFSRPTLLQELFKEFPGVQVSSATFNRLTKKYYHHLLTMHKNLKHCLMKKSKTKVQAEDAVRKQYDLAKIIEKDAKAQQHLKEVQEAKSLEMKFKCALRDARLQSAKMKGYYKEFQEEMQKKMQKKNVSEELILEKAFLCAINAQKYQVEELIKEFEETNKFDAEQHLKYLTSLEHLYKNQFSMLSEALAAENQDLKEKTKAQKEAMNSMRREMQEQLKHEIRTMQKTIVEMSDDQFREDEGERFIQKIKKR